MKNNKYFILMYLFALPFAISFLEKTLKYLLLNIFFEHLSVIVYSLCSIGLIVFFLLSKTDFGWNFNKQNKKNIAVLLIVLTISTLFLFSILQIRGLLNDKWSLGWIMWIILVFREEVILRGIIQTKVSQILIGKYLGLSKSIIFSSLVFSLWHLVNLGVFTVQVVLIQIFSVLLIAGPIYGVIKEKTNNIIISYLWHISADFFFFALYTLIFGKLLFPAWS